LPDKKSEILNSARALFSANGFKNTSVADITKLAGVAAGTFYLYYTSKDALFMQLYLEENEKLKREILAAVDLDGEPLRVMQEIMVLNLNGMNANPILREWYNRDVFEKIEHNFRAENGLAQVDFLYDRFAEVVKKWQADGKMRRDIDSGMIMAMFTSIITMDIHKQEIGVQFFPEILGYLAEFVMKGLTERR
jgi:AcrR family transcriptional regulator